MANIDFDKLFKETQRTYNLLVDESLWFNRGSDEFKNVKKQMEEDMLIWERLLNKQQSDPNYKMSDYEIQMTNRLLANQDMMIDTYLENKAAEQKSLKEKGKDLSDTAKDRVRAMKNAKTTVASQMKALDEDLAARLGDETVPTKEEILKESNAINTDLEEATKGVWGGSGEFNIAKLSNTQINSKWKALSDRYSDQNPPDAGTLQYMKSQIMVAQSRLDDYLLKKGDEADNDKSRKRMTAVGRSRENMNKMLRKIADWEKKNEEKDIPKNNQSIEQKIDQRYGNIQRANEGTFIGSSEYRTAMKAIEEQRKIWKRIIYRQENNRPTADELNELERLNEIADKNINKYLYNKSKSGPNSEREKKRFSAMLDAKRNVADQKKLIAGRRKELATEYDKKSVKDINKEALDAEMAIDDSRSKVYFASKAFKEARKKYLNSYDKWQDLENKSENYELSKDEIKEMKEELLETKKAISTYIDSKRGKDLIKNPKTKRRLDAMRQADRNIDLRLYKLEQYEKKYNVEAEQEEKRNYDERVTSLKTNVKDKAGIEKNMARASLAATQKLSTLAQKDFATTLDKKEARRAVAALVLEERIKDLPDAEVKKLKSSQAYAKAIKDIADSQEFKAALPDSKLTPTNFKQFVKNPETVKKIRTDFDKKMAETKEKQKKKNKAKENKKELKNNDNQRKIS